MRRFVAFSAIVALSASASLAQSWRGAEALRLQVNDSKGRPIQGARVTLTFQGVSGGLGPDIVATDANGSAVLAELAPGPWQVDVQHPDFLSYVAMIDVRRGKKPLVSASFLEARGRSLSPLRVKFGKGDPDRASPVSEARKAPAAVPEPQTPPTPAPAPAPQPAAPAAPEPAPTAEEATAPVPEPQRPPTPAPAPAPQPATPATPRPEPPPLPEVVPVSPPREVPAKPDLPPQPAAAPPTAPPAAAGALPPPPAPALAVASYRDGSCADCATGEWSMTVSAAAPATADAGSCGAALAETTRSAMRGLSQSIQLELEGFIGPLADGSSHQALERAEPDLTASLRGELAPFVAGASPCQIVAAVLPKAVRFTRVRYAAGDQQDQQPCTPGQDCPIGEARWLGGAGVESGPSATVIFALFENRSSVRDRRALLTVYFRPPNAHWRPRLPGGG